MDYLGTIPATTNRVARFGDITGGSAMTYTDVTTTTQTMVAGNGYTANNAGLVTLTLPATAAYGTEMVVAGKGAGGWRISQLASQILHVTNLDSTTGTGGYIASTARRDSVRLICVVANLEWEVLPTVGNITVV